MKLFKIIASRGGHVLFDDRIEAACPREARGQMRALLGLRSLTGIVYSITEIPVGLIADIAEARLVEALRHLEGGAAPPSMAEAIRVAAEEEVRRQLGQLRAEALACQPPRARPDEDRPTRFDPFSGGEGEPSLPSAPAPVPSTDGAAAQGGATPQGDVVGRVRANVEGRQRRQAPGGRGTTRPSVTADGREIDWRSVKELYLRNHSLKQTAATFDLSVNTVKARARKEGWARR